MDQERRKQDNRPAVHRTSLNRVNEVAAAPVDDRPAFVPRIATADIYYEMIAAELRNGRLTRSRRKRIIQYAAQLGLSPVQAGRLITECREQAMQSHNPIERRQALKLVEPMPERIPIAFKLAIVVVIALMIDLVVIYWSL